MNLLFKWVRAFAGAPISTVVGTAIVLFFAVSAGSITLLANAEMSNSNIGFVSVSSKTFQQHDKQKVLGLNTLAPGVISSCGDITTPGTFILNADLQEENNTCLNIHDTDNVNLDCQNYAILSMVSPIKKYKDTLLVKNVRNFSVKNCNFHTINNAHSYSDINISVNNSNDGVFEKNIITGNYHIFVSQANNLRIVNNESSAPIAATKLNNSYILNNNIIIDPDQGPAGVIELTNGGYNTVSNNNINGRWRVENGIQLGADDGIMMTDETSDTLKDNKISNVWDCGIENAGAIVNTVIENNVINNAAICGIGGWYWNSWKGSTFVNNTVSNSQRMFDFYRDYGLRPQDQYVYFQDNVFRSNKFINPKNGSPSSNFYFTGTVAKVNPGEQPVTPQVTRVGNNIFVNNDFGKAALPPEFYPNSLAIDGGGNICGQVNSQQLGTYPLKCGNGTLTTNQKPTGSLDGVKTEGIIFGWASDVDDLSKPVSVHLYIDKNAGTAGAVPIGIIADQFRSDVGSHAFNFTIPNQYRDGQQHQVWAWAIDLTDNANNTLLSGSPKTFTLTPAGMQNSTVISSCGEIKSSGNYTLSVDLKSDKNTCLYIHDASNINLDCQGHEIYSTNADFNKGQFALKIENAKDFSVRGCNVKQNIAYNNGNVEVTWPGFLVLNSSNGLITNNTLRGMYVNTFNGEAIANKISSNLTVSNNNFTSFYQQSLTNNSKIINNSFILETPATTAALISTGGGSNNLIEGNNIDGKWDGTPLIYTGGGSHQAVGADDGIYFGGEDKIIIQNNTFINVYDCGIESLGLITNAVIKSNTIKNAGVCGIGAWWSNSWKDNLVADNNVYDAPALFLFYRSFGLQPQEQFVYFLNNTFSNNKLVSVKTGNNADNKIDFVNFDSQNFGIPLTTNLVIVGNNKFINNDFNTFLYAPILKPTTMFVDGGGNICGEVHSSIVNNYPLNCTTVNTAPPSARTGQLVNINNTIYLVATNGLYGFPDLITFNSWNLNFANVVPANEAEKQLRQIGIVPVKLPCFSDILKQIASGLTSCPIIIPTPTPTPTPTVTPTPTTDPVINRGQAANKLMEKFSLPGFSPSTQSFSDVPSGSVYFNAVEQLYARGITGGCEYNAITGSRRYCPNDPTKRWQFIIFLGKSLGNKINLNEAPTAQIFRDVPPTNLAYNYVQYFYSKGVFVGCRVNLDGTRDFCPDDDLTLYQLNTFIDRTIANIVNGLVSPTPTPTPTPTPSITPASPTLTVVLDGSSKPSTTIPGGTNDTDVASFKLIATGGDIRVWGIDGFSDSSSCPVGNLKLYDGATQIANLATQAVNCKVTFSALNLIVPQNTTKVLILKTSVPASASAAILKFGITVTKIIPIAAGVLLPGPNNVVYGNTMTIVPGGSLGGDTSATSNLALASKGATARASSEYSSAYAASSVIKGNRAGASWGSGGGWLSGWLNNGSVVDFPNWVEVSFPVAKTINKIDVFTIQDSYSAPIEPTTATTFSNYGIVDFQIQYDNGGGWQTVPGGQITGNNKIWTSVSFSAIGNVNKVRVYVTKALAGFSRITNVEAYGY